MGSSAVRRRCRRLEGAHRSALKPMVETPHGHERRTGARRRCIRRKCTPISHKPATLSCNPVWVQVQCGRVAQVQTYKVHTVHGDHQGSDGTGHPSSPKRHTLNGAGADLQGAHRARRPPGVGRHRAPQQPGGHQGALRREPRLCRCALLGAHVCIARQELWASSIRPFAIFGSAGCVPGRIVSSSGYLGFAGQQARSECCGAASFSLRSPMHPTEVHCHACAADTFPLSTLSRLHRWYTARYATRHAAPRALRSVLKQQKG